MASFDAGLFTGAIPEIYEHSLVPLIFASFAADLASRAAETQPRDILEVAAGTGAVTRELVHALPDAHITATDLNEPMLKKAAASLADEHVTWRQADAQTLPYDLDAFDLVICQFGVMFFPDRPRAYRQVARVLRPTGRFLFNVWDSLAHNDFSRVVSSAVAGLYEEDPPQFLAGVPYAYHDRDAVTADLLAAGFREPEWAVLTQTSRASSPLEAATAICHGTPLRLEIEKRTELSGVSLSMATERSAAAIGAAFGDGAIEGKMQAVVISAIC